MTRKEARRRAGVLQRGFGGVLVLILVAGMAAAGGLYAFYRTDNVQAKIARDTDDALAAAKAALIGYAVSRGGVTGNARPGELPCPDTDLPGTPGYGDENTPCNTTTRLVGRLPWRTLGIPELRDADGEPLWYVLAPGFRSWDSHPVGTSTVARRLNIDSRGTLAVRGPDGASTLVSDAVAVVIAAGAPLGSQNRGGAGAGTMLCALTGTAIARQACADNYLDAALNINNASGSGPFIAAPRSDRFNDRLIHITAADFMPAVEMRVGAELKALLLAYRANSACQCYPWADNWAYSGGIADTGQNRGRFPSLPEPEPWGANGIPAFPQWIAANDWHNFFWYSVGRQNSHVDPVPERRCRTCSDHPMLRVGDSWASALLFTPGPPLDGIARMNPPPGQAARRDNLALYLEDAQNNDGASGACPDVGEIGDATPPAGNFKGALSCDTYVVPSATGRNRDRLITVGTSDPAVCTAQTSTLLANATCAAGGGAIKPVCQTAVAGLDACPCLEAARVMVTPPCMNTTNPPQCQAAIAQLKSCS